MNTLLCLLSLLAVVAVQAAPNNPPDLLEGFDEFLAAFDGFALAGDPLAEPEEPEDGGQELVPELDPTELPAVTKVAPCLGCVLEITADSAALRETAELAANLLGEKLNSSAVLTATEVYSATRQVVNGILYQLTVEVSETNCTRQLQLPEEEALCLPLEGADRRVYDVTLLLQPHRNHSEVTQAVEVSGNQISSEPIERSIGLFHASETISELSSTSGLSDVADGANLEISDDGTAPLAQLDLSEVFGIL